MPLIRRLAAVACAVLGGIALPGSVPARAAPVYIAGYGDVPLVMEEAGERGRPAILLIHGLGQGYESFRAQLDSDLARKYHLVTFDLRGHGMSGKPWAPEAYTDTKAWAGDVSAVMKAAGLERAVVLAWSYGTMVTADYLRHEGPSKIAGLVLVGALGGFVGMPPPPSAVPQALGEARALQASPSARDNIEAARRIVPFLAGPNVPAAWLDMSQRLMSMVPNYALVPLRTHSFNNRDVIDKLTMPVLVAHGTEDGGTPQAAVDALLAAVPGARESRYQNMGHSPFAEDAARFNRELDAFAGEVLKAK